ncbi:MAG TPA: ABC transporter permease, partial [Thermoanaerobaculia bacterium]|nr:ABC transporter permease [Thermoanaerobaculia bacterium]
MSWKKIAAIARREYVERVRTKAFWIATLLIPILFLGFVAIQVSISRKTGGERRIAVVDLTGGMEKPLADELAAIESRQSKQAEGKRGPHWTLDPRAVTGSVDATKDALRREVLSKQINGYLVLDPKDLDNGESEYFSTTVSDYIAQIQLQDAIHNVWMRQRIQARGLPGDLASDLERRMNMKVYKVNEKGAAEEKGAGILAVLVFLVLMYSTFFMYGYQVMRGTIEEKSNRIVEIVIASVRPTELMLGKIIGIGLVGLTQYLVWSLVATNLSLPVVAGMLSGGGDMGIPHIPVSLLGYFMLFFMLGYFLYASIYTTIAAPFNTDQEAQQLAMIPMMLILLGFLIYPAVMNNPNGNVALFFSLFPFTASLVMFLRTAVSEPPAWQILLSVVLLLGTTVVLAWFAGRIYRVG